MVEIDGRSLTLEELGAAARGGETCTLAAAARARVEAGRAAIEKALQHGDVVYGVNTGFGDLSSVRIPADKLLLLQERLVLSHAAGMGEPLPDDVVRAMLLLRANTLAQGHSGVRPQVVNALLALLAHDLLPVVPSRGSVGASGDLAPLAHLALVLIGRGTVRERGQARPAAEALAAHGLAPLVLEAKEGLALINGTQAMTALVALAVLEMRRLVRAADLVGALSTDALRGTDAAFDARLHALRPYDGQQASARNLWRLLQGSGIRESHRQGDVRVQDPYSIRCMPQVHGACRDLLADVERKVLVEMNAVTDNPLVFPDTGEVISGGNFHGEPMAFAADVLALAAAEVGAIAERRLEKLTNHAFSGLPPFLVQDAGLDSGFMIAQVTAAALASESKGLCHPASVDSIPTSADKEDHVSMGMGAALKLQGVVANTRRILAIELLAAAQGVDLLRPLRSSAALERLHAAIRTRVPVWEQDREMAPDLAAAENFLANDLDAHIMELE
ncbi:MAG TPA: histidine ammonia-lyase [Thermoanaerobaculia bacterium]|jgi:histidine ammonia-lyase|nr:histidine ammonia-lyase [Thermoanaerobaculia bacterium]